MNETELFEGLDEKKKDELMELLRAAYRIMNTEQRRTVFGKTAEKVLSLQIDGKKLLKKVKQFHRDSLAGKYYASFDMNSKNFTHIPEETDEWFEALSDLLENSARLSKQGEHSLAVQCFMPLYELIEAVDSGCEIVFADELGSWMIPGDQKKFVNAYLRSLAQVSTPEEFTKAAVSLIREDSCGESFFHKVHSTALRVANKEQKNFLQTEIERHKIKTELTVSSLNG